MNCLRIPVLCFAILHYVVAYAVLWCVCPKNGLNSVMSSVYLVFCVQHIMAIESLFPRLEPKKRNTRNVIELCKCCWYLTLELTFFLSHCGILIFFLHLYLHWGACLLLAIHFVVHCVMSYVSVLRISETCRFMFCDIRNGTSWTA